MITSIDLLMNNHQKIFMETKDTSSQNQLENYLKENIKKPLNNNYQKKNSYINIFLKIYQVKFVKFKSKINKTSL